jgi:signal transduction histidine kinase
MSMVDAVLELSLAGRDLQLAEVDLNSLLDDVTEDLREMIDEEHAQVVVDRLPAVTCDRVQVLRVLEILIKNAIMYNKNPAKRIEIGTSPRASADQPPTIYVRDNGVGIAPEDRERVFELFSRVQAHADFGGGSGTGLAMVKKLVQSHGGVVWVESRLGEGSTFYFTFGPERSA